MSTKAPEDCLGSPVSRPFCDSVESQNWISKRSAEADYHPDCARSDLAVRSQIVAKRPKEGREVADNTRLIGSLVGERLCRDSTEAGSNLLKLRVTDGFFWRSEIPSVTVIGPLSDPRPLPCKPLPYKNSVSTDVLLNFSARSSRPPSLRSSSREP